MQEINVSPLLAAMRDAKEVADAAAPYFLKPAPALNGRLSLHLEGEPVGDPQKIKQLRGQWGMVAAHVNNELHALGDYAHDALAAIYKMDLL